jgi:hypothetical protein
MKHRYTRDESYLLVVRGLAVNLKVALVDSHYHLLEVVGEDEGEMKTSG